MLIFYEALFRKTELNFFNYSFLFFPIEYCLTQWFVYSAKKRAVKIITSCTKCISQAQKNPLVSINPSASFISEFLVIR